MTRPAARKSSLAGHNPITPPAERDDAVALEPTPAPSASTTTEKVTPRASTKTTKYPPKVSFYQDPADTDRIRGAILHTMVSEGNRNLSQFLNAAAMEKVAALEAKYNNGQPFPSIGAREMPQGRPLGDA